MSLADQLKILIVDDTTTSRMLVRDGLQEIGIKNISFASDGEQGLKHVMTQQTHLVISDFNMPKLDGLGLLRAIRQHGPIQKTPFIMLTGKGDKELVQKAIQFGINNYLTKPFTVPALKGALEAVVGKLS
ncbi:response regulator [Hyphomicrobium sulfonivorans]|uniref:Chemotaxis protein cheY n=1 Tax=Hyphomicrobium sulfonivorans TaxID=121290 RepID=A0A109BBQ2_HYPSL|nr:response regulator [Hyphomicrobium sulfonivorans]KWT65853.1 Chemotaxis protein cheY [Hyphomicrobium sulfonivorans]MBI1648788.1 response regulator [Hyphomicrobium sulfonivorans]NSL70677.1 response regulator [Hyphomicrobium sulfonivorans]